MKQNSENLEKESEGKIIAVVGTSNSGKTYLSNRLKAHYHGFLIEEAYNSFPGDIKGCFGSLRGLSDSERVRRYLKGHLYARNHQANEILLAEILKKEGKYVILDTFWMSGQLYASVDLKDYKREKECFSNLGRLDHELLPWPDVIVFLNTTDGYIKRKLEEDAKRKGRELKESRLQSFLDINEEHRKVFNPESGMKNLIILDKDRDFTEEEIEEIFKKIDQTLYKQS